MDASLEQSAQSLDVEASGLLSGGVGVGSLFRSLVTGIVAAFAHLWASANFGGGGEIALDALGPVGTITAVAAAVVQLIV
jgi:hypothetical protein